MNRHAVCVILIAALLCALPNDVAAAYLPVHGGPEYFAATGTGYRDAFQPRGNLVTDGGVGVGHADKFVAGLYAGTRAVRWDSTAANATELDHLGTNSSGIAFSFSSGINNSGTTAGYSEKYVAGTYLGTRAVRWDGLGTIATELDHLETDSFGVTSSYTSDVNNSGTVVGYAQKYVSGNYVGTRAVRWVGPGTTATELEHVDTDGFTDSYASAVNEQDTAVGYKAHTGTARAVRWDGSGTSVVELEFPGTAVFTGSWANDVNNSDTAVGSAYLGTHHAVRWDGSGTAAIELDHLGTDASAFSVAYALNDSGTAVGRSDKVVSGISYGARAVRWDGSGTGATELGNLGTDSDGATLSSAEAVNNSGIAVGWANTFVAGSFVDVHAVVWKGDALAIDLNTLIDPASGWTLTHAFGVSETGWISGIGRFDPDGAGGDDEYYRLFSVQVPEPSTLLLAVLSAIGLSARRPYWN